MPDKKEDTKTTIVESAAKGGMSAAMPYVVVIGGGLLAYKYLKDEAPNFIGGAGGIAGGVNEYVKEIVKTTTDKVNDGLSRVNDGLSGGGDTIINLFDKAKDEVSKDIDITKATTEGIADTILPGSDGIKTSSPLAPAASSLFNIGVVTGNSGFMGGGVGLGIAGALANKFGGYASKYSKSSYTNKAGELQSANVSEINTAGAGVSLPGSNPMYGFMSSNPLKLGSNTAATSNKSTKRSTASAVKASGMSASNLKNASSVSTMTDKTGKERVVVKYKNGVTLRY